MSTKLTIDEIEDIGEESGRDEAGCDFPYLPLTSKLLEDEKRWHHWRWKYLQWRGRGRAQGNIYGYRGKAAKKFAWCWASGYASNCSMWEEEGMLPDERRDEAQGLLLRLIEDRAMGMEAQEGDIWVGTDEYQFLVRVWRNGQWCVHASWNIYDIMDVYEKEGLEVVRYTSEDSIYEGIYRRKGVD